MGDVYCMVCFLLLSRTPKEGLIDIQAISELHSCKRTALLTNTLIKPCLNYLVTKIIPERG